MNVKLPDTDPPWVDPDDAPELGDELFEKGAWKMGERVVTKQQAQTAIAQTMRRGRPLAQVKRPMLSIRVDPEVLEKLRASGKGWQTRLNAVLREAVEHGKV
ncbi:hypothetical protein D8B34_27070 [Verminephrobacter eiseniae]|nr:hypothetical protein [Verminephrobacter eiseniae]MCW5293081.1 hypothetical protein [Verminephrobacter eiseniae]MCW8187168.1 hypothetical protein [Verminephrobacter eiseniae]MCW8226353.1 hypothetical protein [Verminephrobacter eiseniae]MCW8237201.1 hypothetical protein [Verminephrobacter eiseniae]